MTKVKFIIITGSLLFSGACADYDLGLNPGLIGGLPQDKSVDRGIDKKPLSNLKAGIWVDPNGCDHWIIDDGLEGYMDARLDPGGRPVCSGIAPPTHTSGDFKAGSKIGDPN
ncbi:MAG: hypothetical protein ACJAVM_001266 [Sulfitobacter sp.]|jgi:hypothetical protein